MPQFYRLYKELASFELRGWSQRQLERYMLHVVGERQATVPLTGCWAVAAILKLAKNLFEVEDDQW